MCDQIGATRANSRAPLSGFVVQILIAAVALAFVEPPSCLGVLHRTLAVSAVAGILVIAAGNISRFPLLKFTGVMMMVASTLALAVTCTVLVADTARDRLGRLLLLVSAASVAVAMLLACVYGIGELLGREWIGIREMVASHGLVNAIGFALCGIFGHLRLRRRGAA